MKTEQETRIELIDTALQAAGWNVNDPGQVVQEYDIVVDPNRVAEATTPYRGRQFSDYVLLGRDREPLAVVEAKKTSKDAALGREQAKQYCYNIQRDKGCDLPFCFYTNGLEIYFWDLGNYRPRKIVGFPTLDDLERFRYIHRNKKSLTDELINTDIAGRDYQIRAIRTVLEAIERNQRDFLLVMATGTGKTRTAIALVDALMRAAHIERVLFLVDRIALREQALSAFKEHLPNEPRWPNVGEKLIATDRRIYVATYPTMLNIIRDASARLSPHFFDLVVIDESHRSIYNTYGEILDYFKTLNLGLTATPTDVIDHNTFKLFACEDGLPTFAYTFQEAVQNTPPYLCDFQVMKIQTKFQKEGISKRTISLEDQKKLILEGKDIEEINFEGSQLEKQVINKGTNTLIVKAFMEECVKDANGVLPGKTIFFCASMAHARRMEEIFDALYPQYNGELAKVLVSEDPRVYGKGGLLDQFKHSNMPRVAISVDKLHTKEMVEFGPHHEAVSIAKYREMVEALVLDLTRANPILQKIKKGAEITSAEADQLADLLHKTHPHVTENLLRVVYQNRKARFIQFIRHILGIETLASFPDTVAQAFDQFIAEHTNLNSRQLEFLRLLKAFVIEREKVEKRDLIQSPFTVIHPQGIRGVFRPSEIDEILKLTEQLAA
jgi:type I restriction enzyme, R subunit